MSTVGILALQGDFAKHERKIEQLGQRAQLVRTLEQLELCNGLIIPGGESTTLTKLLKKHGLWQEVIDFAAHKPVYGTCAGCILVANTIAGIEQDSLKLIDITVARNAYGRQIDSFIDDIRVQFNGKAESMEGVFIRAPKIISIGDKVTPLAWHRDDIILAEQGNVLVGTFHPELTDDLRVHNYFLHKIEKQIIRHKEHRGH